MDTSALTDKTYTGTQGKVLEMLGNGLTPEIVATALGLSAGYISQLMSEETFAMQVTDLRFKNLQAATARDRKYDAIEDKLIERMDDLLPLMYKPMDVLRAITVINSAKRRGTTTQESTVINQQIVQLSIPSVLMERFAINGQGQVVSAGEQDLITIQTSQLTGLRNKQLGVQNEATNSQGAASPAVNSA